MNEGVSATPAGFATEIEIDKPTIMPGQNTTPAPATTGVKPFLESIPQEYAQKEWAQNFAKTENPLAELLKSYDNQIALVGKKNEGLRLPGEGATPEDWQNFHKAIGVPESADKYEYKAPEVPEELKDYFQTDENFLSKIREAAIKAGVRPEGFKHLAEAYDQYYLSELQQAVNNTKAHMQKLEQDFKGKFGERSNQVLDSWKNSFSSMLGKEQAAVLDGLDPTVKVVLAEHFDNFAKKYVREDSLNLGVPSAGNSVMTKAEYGERYEQLFAQVRGTTPGSAEHARANSALAALRSEAAKIFT